MGLRPPLIGHSQWSTHGQLLASQRGPEAHNGGSWEGSDPLARTQFKTLPGMMATIDFEMPVEFLIESRL